jgi:hypothetical protein
MRVSPKRVFDTGITLATGGLSITLVFTTMGGRVEIPYCGGSAGGRTVMDAAYQRIDGQSVERQRERPEYMGGRR